MKKTKKQTAKKGSACVECGATMRTEKGDFKFTITPRWAVTVADSELHTCPRCGNKEGTVVKASALEKKIAAEVLAKDSPLAPDEVKFLVESFDWTKRQVAARLGIAPETLSRYEQGAYRISPAVDRLLRLMVAVLYVRDQDLASAVVSNPVAGKTTDPLKLTLRLDPHGEYQVVGESPSGRHQVAA